MRLFAYLFFTALLVQWLFPWWSFVPLCLLAGFGLARSGGQAFLNGFLAIGLGWALVATAEWLLTNSLLPNRVATLLELPSGALLVLIAGVVSGLLGGLACITGWWLKRAAELARPTA